MTGLPDLSVIVVGLNARGFVDQCWATVKSAGARTRSMELIYVDNGSTDGTVAFVREKHPDVIILENDSNLGFCKAANQGARAATSEMLCFLNDDVIVLDNALETLTDYVRQTPEIGAAGLRLLNVDRSDQWSGRRFPTMLNGLFARRSPIARMFPDAGPLRRYLYRDEIAAARPFDADWVSAAGMVAPRRVFFEVGGFDESYYYWHEAVFCDRVARAGYRVVLHPEARIVHYEGFGSGKRDPAKQRWHIRDFHVGAFRCYLEHHGLGHRAPRALLARQLLAARKTLLLGISHTSETFGRR